MDGTYYCTVLTTEGETHLVCPATYHDLTQTFTVLIHPNPATAHQPFDVTITGLDEQELSQTTLTVYDMDGKRIASQKGLYFQNSLTLPDGQYLIVVDNSTHGKIVHKTVVQ